MKAVILVGGEGTRLRPLTLHCLKSLAPMAGRPFLEYQLSWLRSHGIREIVLSICYLPQLIRKHLGDGSRFGVRLHYAQERSPLGTAGAIKNAQTFLGRPDTVAVLNGDVLTQIDLTRMAAEHRRRHSAATLALTPVDDPSAYGLVRLDPRGRILSFVEKPSTEETGQAWINAGVYLFEPRVFDHIPAGKNYSAERGLFPGLLAANERLGGFKSQGYWLDIGTLDRYLQAHLDLLEGRAQMLPAGKPWRGQKNIRLGARTRVQAQAKLTGPLVLGDVCEVHTEAAVGPLSVLGHGVIVGPKASVRRSVLWDRVSIGEGARLEGCVLAAGCRIGRYAVLSPGTVLGQGAVVPDYSRL